MNTPNIEAKDIYYKCLNTGMGYISDYLAGEFAHLIVQELQENADTEYYKKVEKALKKLLKHK